MTRHAPIYADRVVAITGARKGVGRMLVDHFLEEGAIVIGISRGDQVLPHDRYHHFSLDVGDATAVRLAFAEIARMHRRMDIVVNSAAVLTSTYALMMPAAAAEEMVKTNVLGALYVGREAAKLMRKRKFGRIINIGSMASVLEPVGDSVYAATKSAAMTLTGVLAKEFSSYGITVNTLGISAIETDMLGQLPVDRVLDVIDGLPLPRFATPADVFHVIDFFASPESSYVTAQSVFLGGVHP